MRRGEETFLVHWDTVFQAGDLVAIVGRQDDLDEIVELLGEKSDIELTREISDYEHQRVFVSNTDVAGQRISALNLHERFSAIITRVRRGDADLIARGDTVIEL